MRPLPRTQAPTVFQRRWPRSRRLREAKNVPEVRTRTFEYHRYSDDIKARFRADCREAFPRGEVSIQPVENMLYNTMVYVVTQTKAQRRQ